MVGARGQAESVFSLIDFLLSNTTTPGVKMRQRIAIGQAARLCEKCLFLFAFAWALVLGSCQTQAVKSDTELEAASHGVEKVLVLPFEDMSRVYGKNMNTRCPVCGRVFMTGEVASGGDQILTEMLVERLKDIKSLRVIAFNPAQSDLEGLLSENINRESQQEFLARIGKSYGADGVIAGYIYRFRERVGTNYSVETPASVAFGLHFVDTESGKILWSGHFEETQKSLFANLFDYRRFFQRRGKWLTADGLAASGLDDMMETFPEL